MATPTNSQPSNRTATDPLRASIDRSASAIQGLARHEDVLRKICDTVVGALRGGHKVLTAGHGGSAADAMHMAEEFVGHFDAPRRPLPAVALAADPTLLTCIGNDYGFEHIFERQIEALGHKGDVLVLFSTSGKAPGLRLAVEAARAKGVVSIALLGKGGGPLRGLADLEVVVESQETARIQEVHTLILHLVLESVERANF